MQLGSVPYLNALPLVAGLSHPVQVQTPRDLLGSLRQGRVDLALLSTVSLLENPEFYLVPGMGIGCNGPIQSVKLFFNKCDITIRDLNNFKPSPESNTANILAQLLCKGVGHLLGEKVSDTFLSKKCPTLIGGKSTGHLDEAELVIGDAALTRPAPYGSVDLGELWRQRTGLPFVFAAWISRQPQIPRSLWEELMAAKERNLANLDACIAASPLLPEWSPEAKCSYLLNNIHYELGDTELAGLQKFRDECIRAQLLPHAHPIQFAEII